MLAKKNQDIKKAYDRLQIISRDEKARMRYEAREAELRDQLIRMKSAENKGKAEGKAEAICQYLEVRFGAESQDLQAAVRTMTDLDVLARITSQIFLMTHFDEAKALIQGGVISR